MPALEAVLGEVEREDVDAIVVGGDIAAGPPQPREVIELVRALPNAQWIRGNADRVFDEEFAGDEGLEWLLEQLDREQADWLAHLPFSVVIEDTLYVHATPQDDTTAVTDATTDEKLTRLLRGVDQPRVVAGHTHMQLQRRVGDTVFVNAGSVGRPYEGRHGAFWAILDEAIELRCTDYDRERAAGLIRASGHPRADEIAMENILASPTRELAIEVLGG